MQVQTRTTSCQLGKLVGGVVQNLVHITVVLQEKRPHNTVVYHQGAVGLDRSKAPNQEEAL